MPGLFVGALHLFVMVNACVRSIGSRWLLGSMGALLRIFLLIAIAMASARIRLGGAQPSSSFSIALFAGPAVSVILLALAYRRRATARGSDAEATARRLVTAWAVVAAIDVLFVAVGIGSRLMT